MNYRISELPLFLIFKTNSFIIFVTDLLIFGHEHFYIRTKPIYNYNSKINNFKIDKNGQKTNPYHDPIAPVHITTGNAVFLIF